MDDTGARHAGKNGYCTHIGNELFAWFKSTGSKSRINFLELLQEGHEDYQIQRDALDYMKQRGLDQNALTLLKKHQGSFLGKEDWQKHLDRLGIDSSRHRQIATEGALIGGERSSLPPTFAPAFLLTRKSGRGSKHLCASTLGEPSRGTPLTRNATPFRVA